VTSAEAGKPVAYRIDQSDNFVAVNEAWCAFASANDGERLLPPAILGTVLWHWIGDATTRELYRSALKRVRAGTGTVRFSFRCDSPSARRLLQMQIAGAPDGAVDFETKALVIQPRSSVLLLSAHAPRSAALLTMCSWCARIPDGTGRWLEVEDAIEALRLFETHTVPQLTHGICPSCAASMEAVIDDSESAASGTVSMGAL